ncbi:MAG: hypothetical protein COW66_01630 [Flavobacteriaceae bacterium CG18_big_fil_WC_8_21_14_2_50_34_36]|nr:MAG: hypothetical protein COW66_01630 [Flavobacteriaceae bacterium CG18_big_fil_WC_8_21_14_2_50_34_36]
MISTNNTAGNRRLAKKRVQWLNEALCFVSSSVLADSFVLRNPLLRQAPNRWQTFKMKKLILLLLFFSSCLNEKETKTPERISPPTIEYNKDLKPKIIVEEFYFHGADSSELNLQRVIEYYSKKRIATESHLLTSSTTQEGLIYFYDYQDTTLVQKRTVDKRGDSTKVTFDYNETNQLIKREHFTFTRRLRPEIIEKQKESADWLISESDYEENRSWDKISEIEFSYDSIGRKIKYYAPNLHWDNQNKYKWLYDEEGNIQMKQSWNNDELIWTEHYTYDNNEVHYTRVWKDKDFQKDLEFLIFMNKNGQKIKELTLKNGNVQNKRTFEYYANGMLKKKIVYGENDEPLTTYIYKKNDLPTLAISNWGLID